VKRKLERFAEMESFPNVIQPSFAEAFRTEHPLKGNWNRDFFRCERPLILELGCGKGEYTVGLARVFPSTNFIGVDIKGSRIWKGAKTALLVKILNAGFLRIVNSSVLLPVEAEIWLTFVRNLKKENYPGKISEQCRFLKTIIIRKPNNDFVSIYARHNPCNRSNHPQYGLMLGTTDPFSINIYEKRFIEQGLAIHYISFRLPHEKYRKVRASDPDF
jgi:tRNA (guanine-N7-)-methyltransferase